ncbi:hypothetical protein FOH10_28905 [Nocardia otitidiscaviarum]|uniref:Lipoprotein n=1 Tax=Nocardia otitidiscaviarum TaxID=1823 RepID=A0A516NTG7_9NOCA|nr:hypothetical protein [Nocardia otitidiscaviarum]MCP9621446.1 hypothetical protein [Nocardia otitidiscaviarum]QDP82151.1 hypothetical protein FOH10_28905 [Nocardia otitidiscaviarum]
MKPNLTTRISLALPVLITAMVTSSCSTEPPPDATGTTSVATSTTQAEIFPYPPLQFRSNIAVPVNEAEADAATTALKVEVAINNYIVSEDESYLSDIYDNVSEEGRPYIGIPGNLIPETGGETYRAVSIEQKSGAQWVITVCDYNTPGVYEMGDDGELTLSTPTDSYSPIRYTVAMTTEASASGQKASTPRPLVVDQSTEEFAELPGQQNDLARQTCEPFRPDPYIQEPPERLPAEK